MRFTLIEMSWNVKLKRSIRLTSIKFEVYNFIDIWDMDIKMNVKRALSKMKWKSLNLS